jgi:hypothetical protein
MRRLLAVLAVLGLLSAPLQAAAAQMDCAQMAPQAMAGMDMGSPSDAASDSKAAPADPCCDHGKSTPTHQDKSCAMACAAMCGVTAVLISEPLGVTLVSARVSTKIGIEAPLRAHSPPPDERPPRSIV